MKKIIIVSLALILSLSACSVSNNIEKNDVIISESSSEDDVSAADSDPVSLSESSSVQAETEQNNSETSSNEENANKNDKTISEMSESKQISTIGDNVCEYYQKLSGFDLSAFYKENVILDGKNVDFNTVVTPYSLNEKYNILRNESEYDAFISDYKESGKLWDMYCVQNNYYFATAYKGEEQYGITLEPKGDNYIVGQVGGIPQYLIPSETQVLNKISEIYKDTLPKGRYIHLTQYLKGILLTDGTKENILILESIFDFADELKVNNIYSAKEVVEAVEKMKDIVVSN